MNPFQISIRVDREMRRLILPILSTGFKTGCRNGQTLNQFLYHEMGFEQDYIDQRIQTVFLNGRAVDDFHSTRIQEGAVIALSAAMPGLVGATLRKGGHYSALRKNIDCEARGRKECRARGMVLVKLFNLIAREIGPEFLKQGILIESGLLEAWLNQHLDKIRNRACPVKCGARPLNPDELPAILGMNPEVILKVSVCG